MIDSKRLLASWPAALAAALFVGPLATAHADDITLNETGSTLILPLFQVWATDYAKSHPGVTITTAGTGSAEGIEAAVSGKVQIGASDAYMSDDQARANPEILDVPVAISAMTVNYNLPGLKQALKLDGHVLVGIYSGHIRSWDDPAIAKLNPGDDLPHHEIIPVHRAEGSGDTFVFSQYLSFSTGRESADIGDAFHQYVSLSSSWSWEDSVGYGTTIKWPEVPGTQTAKGNQGIVDLLAKTPYAIGYVGISFEQAIDDAKLGTALLKSYSGQFLLPTPQTITAAAAALTPRTPDNERLTLVNAPGNDCYPLINYEYVMVSKTQPNEATAAALRRFLLWAIAPDEANETYLAADHFIPLPAHIWVKSHDQIEMIR